MGPQEFYWKRTLSKLANVGIKGEWTVNLLDKMRDTLVNEALCLGEDAKTLITQTEAWLGKILNPLKLEIPLSKTNILDLFFSDAKPTNVGFGYSSVLPIIVSGLIAQPGEKLIIENPEIHLHPKAQSALIEFLVKVANTGVQVFVESHSDHVLNALRIAVLKEKLNSNDVSVLYFQENTSPTRIDIEADGRIENWPTDFFDQMDNDLNTLLGI
jgi:predicted ATPase